MNKADRKPTLDEIASLCKRRGFIFQSSEIYGGINGFWDYGPLGAELKRNIRDAWWRDTVQCRENIVGLDASIVMHPRVWEASGHVGGFSDPMVDCRNCKKRFKADQFCEEQGLALARDGDAFRLPEGAKCTACGSRDLTEPRAFDLMFRTSVGPVEDASSTTYLRPETAQGIFAQFANVLATSRQKIPFGIAQIGKAFRNEINPRNYTFRSREFEQMELEFFVEPGTDEQWHAYWVEQRMLWYRSIGLPAQHLSQHVYAPDELAHYASACVDILYDFPFGANELEGVAARGDFDLSRHQAFSSKSMEVFDPATQKRFIPHVVEPSAGVDRIALALICNAYRTEWVSKRDDRADVREAEPGVAAPEGYEERTVLRFAPVIAPIKVAVFPLLKNRPELIEKARSVFAGLSRRWPCFWDQVGAIGRRYRRQDEIGTPFCLTVDFETLEDDTVTLRDRDTMLQVRVPVSDLEETLDRKLHATAEGREEL